MNVNYIFLKIIILQIKIAFGYVRMSINLFQLTNKFLNRVVTIKSECQKTSRQQILTSKQFIRQLLQNLELTLERYHFVSKLLSIFIKLRNCFNIFLKTNIDFDPIFKIDTKMSDTWKNQY